MRSTRSWCYVADKFNHIKSTHSTIPVHIKAMQFGLGIYFYFLKLFIESSLILRYLGVGIASFFTGYYEICFKERITNI